MSRAERVLRLVLVTAVSLAGLGWTLASSRPASASCAPTSAWAGVESSSLSDRAVAASVPVTHPVTLTSVTLDVAYAPLSPTPGFAEVLALVGAGVLSYGPNALPYAAPDPNFGPVELAGAPAQSNTTLGDGVLGSAILKTSDGGTASRRLVIPTSLALAPGESVWLRLGEVGPAQDVEGQVVLVMIPAGC